MTVFQLDSKTVHALTNSLRRDAGNLNPLADLNVPATGVLAHFSAAVTGAIGTANTRAAELRDEARRIADAMDLTVDAAAAVDAGTSARLGATL